MKGAGQIVIRSETGRIWHHFRATACRDIVAAWSAPASFVNVQRRSGPIGPALEDLFTYAQYPDVVGGHPPNGCAPPRACAITGLNSYTTTCADLDSCTTACAELPCRQWLEPYLSWRASGTGW